MLNPQEFKPQVPAPSENFDPYASESVGHAEENQNPENIIQEQPVPDNSQNDTESVTPVGTQVAETEEFSEEKLNQLINSINLSDDKDLEKIAASLASRS